MTRTATKDTLISAGLIAAAIIGVAIPGMTYAALFAYVDQSGDVKSVTADTASAAIMTAPNIGTHSGVILLDSAEDAILSD